MAHPTRRTVARGNRPRDAITREQILRVALDVIEEVGLERFTMRALADRLDTYPATIYWHVGNRYELLSSVAELAVSELDLLDPAERPWHEVLTAAARSWRRSVHAHPEIGRWLNTEFPQRLTGIALTEVLVGALSRAGFVGDDLADAFNAFVGSVGGWVALELIAVDRELGAEWRDEYEAEIWSVDADQFPTVAANLDHLAGKVFTLRWQGGADRPLDSSFELALSMWIDGLRSQLP